MGDAGTRRVLLVETDPDYRDEARRAMEQAGFAVVACGGTIEALAILDGAEAFDTLVSRLLMPPGQPHGIALALMIRHGERGDRRGIRVILYAESLDDLPREAVESAPVPIHPRPTSGADLVRLLEGRTAAAS
jgi:CheY-like chemotaxis protein